LSRQRPLGRVGHQREDVVVACLVGCDVALNMTILPVKVRETVIGDPVPDFTGVRHGQGLNGDLEASHAGERQKRTQASVAQHQVQTGRQ
jgi:hypothetical protein